MRESLDRIVSQFDSQTESIRRQLALIDYLGRGGAPLEGLAISKTQAKNMSVIAKGMATFISSDMKVVIQNGSVIILSAFFL